VLGAPALVHLATPFIFYPKEAQLIYRDSLWAHPSPRHCITSIKKTQIFTYQKVVIVNVRKTLGMNYEITMLVEDCLLHTGFPSTLEFIGFHSDL